MGRIAAVIAWLRTGDRWIPACFVGFFVALAIWEAILISTAVGTANGMAQTRAFNKGTDYARVLELDRRQDALGWRVAALFDQTDARAGALRLTAVDADGAPIPNVRPVGVLEQFDGDLNRIPLAFRIQAAGVYEAEIATPSPGRWVASIELRRGDDVYRLRETVILAP